MHDGLTQLIARIDDAVKLGDADAITSSVKQELKTPSAPARSSCPGGFTTSAPIATPAGCCIANDELGYTAVVMTWGPGQRTPLHDHAGIWCVEGVVEGRMDVTQYDLIESADCEATSTASKRKAACMPRSGPPAA